MNITFNSMSRYCLESVICVQDIGALHPKSRSRSPFLCPVSNSSEINTDFFKFDGLYT